MGTNFYKKILDDSKKKENKVFKNYDEIEDILNLFKKYNKVLVFGDVQSGKTSRIEKIRNNIFSKELYDFTIIFGGTNINLSNQTRERLSLSNLKERKYIYLDSSNINNYDANSLFDQGKIVELNIKKDSSDVDKILSFISEINYEAKILIIDDESDYASLNISSNQNSIEGSKIYRSINSLMKLPNAKLCMFTATPYANIINKENNDLFPEIIYKLNNPIEYTGNRFFLDKKDIIYITNFDKWSEGDYLYKYIEDSICYFLFYSALFIIEKNDRYFELLINVDLKTNIMNKCFANVKIALENLLVHLRNWDEKIFEAIFRKQFLEYNNVNKKIIYEKIRYLINFINSNKSIFKLFDKDNEYKSPSKEDLKTPRIIVSGALASRGYTFNNLLVELLINEPKGKNSADTLCQRARWFGYRKEYWQYIRILTSQKIVESFKDVDKINSWIEDKMYNNTLEISEDLRQDLILLGSSFENTALTGGKKNARK